MPAPDKTSLDAIVRAAREILESDGIDGLTMQAVATQVGVRAPSLYKRVRNREELIRLVAEANLTELAERFRPTRDILGLAEQFRGFAHERPAAFRLMMMPGSAIPVADPELLALASEAILRHAGELAGPSQALEAARTLTAWTTGFIAMELGGGFNLGGDVDEAWRFGLSSIITAISANTRETSTISKSR